MCADETDIKKTDRKLYHSNNPIFITLDIEDIA